MLTGAERVLAALANIDPIPLPRRHGVVSSRGPRVKVDNPNKLDVGFV